MPEDRARALLALAQIREDLIGDVEGLEGQPLTGRVVAEQFGKLAACVDALAGIMEAHLSRETVTGLPRTPPKGDRDD